MAAPGCRSARPRRSKTPPTLVSRFTKSPITSRRSRRILDDDARIGCGSYTYVEPQSYWQHFNGPGNGTYAERLAQLEREATDGSIVARTTLTSGAIRHDGRRDLYLGDVAYTPLRPWGSDANPLIAGGKGAY